MCKKKIKKSEILGGIRIPNSLRPPMFHKPKKGKGSYNRNKVNKGE